MKSVLAMALSAILFSPSLWASDIAKDVRSGARGLDENGGYLSLGIGASYFDASDVRYDDDDGYSFDFVFDGAYQYNGFFVEASHGTADGLNLGYNLYSNDGWSIDLLAASIRGNYDSDDDEKYSPIEDERNEALEDRDTFYNGAGVRITRYYKSYVLQYRLVTDTYGGNGIISTARLGRNWQVRNWNFHAVLSAEYSSSKTNNYLYGVNDREATSLYEEYETGSAFKFVAEVGFAYPISENWVFQGFGRIAPRPSEEKDSPLVSGSNQAIIQTSISYVF